MSIADDLTQLEEMRNRGSLSEDEFQRAKNRLFSGKPSQEPLVQSLNSLRRSTSDRWVGGVCGGLAVAFGLEAWVWRIVFTLLLCVGGTGLAIYIILWLFVPLETPVARLPQN